MPPDKIYAHQTVVRKAGKLEPLNQSQVVQNMQQLIKIPTTNVSPAPRSKRQRLQDNFHVGTNDIKQFKALKDLVVTLEGKLQQKDRETNELGKQLQKEQLKRVSIHH